MERRDATHTGSAPHHHHDSRWSDTHHHVDCRVGLTKTFRIIFPNGDIYDSEGERLTGVNFPVGTYQFYVKGSDVAPQGYWGAEGDDYEVDDWQKDGDIWSSSQPNLSQYAIGLDCDMTITLIGRSFSLSGTVVS